MRNWGAWLAGAGTLAVTAIVILTGGEVGNPDPDRMILLNKTVSETHIIQSNEIMAAKPGDEIVSKRAVNAKVYKITNNTFAAKIKMHDIHYLDPEDGLYKDPDLSAKDVSPEDKAKPDRLFDKYIDPGNGLPKTTWMEGFRENYTFYHPDGNYVKYMAMFDVSIGVAVVHEMKTTKEYITLHDSNEGNILSWAFWTTADYELIGSEVHYKDDNGKFLFRNTAPWAKDATGKDIDIEVKLSPNLLTYTLDIPGDVVYPIIVDPSTTVQAVLDSWLQATSEQYTGGANTGSRDTLDTGGSGATELLVGQSLIGADYKNNRSFLSFPLPSTLNIATVTAGSLYLFLKTPAINDFDINVIPFEGTVPIISTDFVNFDGWQATGVYPPDTLIVDPDVSTSGLDDEAFNVFPFGSRGVTWLDGIVKPGVTDSAQMVLISYEDLNNSAPIASEFAIFSNSTDAGEEPYIGIQFTSIVPTGFTMTAVGLDSMKYDWNDIYTGEDGYIVVDNADTSQKISTLLGAGVTTVTVGGQGSDILFTHAVQVVDYAQEWFGVSASDNESTYPALPTGLAVVPSHQDTVHWTFSAVDNPVTTKYLAMIVGSDGDTLLVDFEADPDTLRTTAPATVTLPLDSLATQTWAWAVRTDIIAFGDSAVTHIPNFTGESIDWHMFVEGLDDGD